MNWERYRDSYGPRVALKFPYDEKAKNALKSSLGFPGIKWDGGKKAWSVRDSPQDLECALEVLADFNYHFVGLEAKEYTEGESDIEIVVRGQKLRMRWPYRPNYAEINEGVKSCGEAKFDKRTKEWIIPLIAGMEVAHAVEPIYEALATAIRDIPQVQQAHEVMAERVLLSSAVDAEHMWLAGLTQMEEVRPYQWVAPHMYLTGNRQRLLLGDEMGLGKSLQALLCVLGGQYRRTLIVCPSVVKANWANEVKKWTDLTASVIYGQKPSEKDTHHDADIAIINYDLLPHRYNEICDLGYECIVFDECHNLKNKNSQRTQASQIIVLTPTVKGIICMSGTPILNRPSELFTVLNMLKPESFPNFFTFGKKYCGATHNGYGWDFGGASNIETSEDGHTVPLNHLLKDVMLRRSMDDPRLSKQMPDLLETIMEIEVDRKAYDEAYNTCMDQLEYYRTTGSGSIPPGLLLNILTELRHSAGRAKIDTAVSWALDYYTQTGKPLVVFAHHKDVVSSIEKGLRLKAQCGLITGATADKDRQRIISGFQEGKIPFLVCSTLAMKEGVNLDASDTTLFVERQWVPAHEKQAAARVRRLTQGSSVCHKVVLSAKDTVDTHFDKVVSGKEAIVKAALDDNGEDKMAIAEAVAASLLKGRLRL